MEDYVGHETPRKQTSFENLLPARSSLSPESQNRRIVKPVFSDIELTGDFESQIIYGKTPPSKSSKPVDPEGKSINDFQLLDASSELKKRSIEAATAAAEDTDFGILSLPENHLPASAAARASASESGQRKTGDVTTADGFDTGVSNSIPGKETPFRLDFQSFSDIDLFICHHRKSNVQKKEMDFFFYKVSLSSWSSQSRFFFSSILISIEL